MLLQKSNFFPLKPTLVLADNGTNFDLQVITMLPTKFQVDWPFGSGEEAKNTFSRWRQSWISDRNDFSCF